MKGKDLTERVYKDMKKDLMLRRLPVNEMISEQMFADRYDCSRTPAREAAGRLVSEGFLNKFPSKGYIVRLLDDREASEARYTRFVLESAALQRSVFSAYVEEFTGLYKLLERDEGDPDAIYFENMRFHCELARLSRNRVMADMIERLHCKLSPVEVEKFYQGGKIVYKPGEYEEKVYDAPNCHREIIEALIRQDVKEAIKWLFWDIYPNMRDRITFNSGSVDYLSELTIE